MLGCVPGGTRTLPDFILIANGPNSSIEKNRSSVCKFERID
jgi:hypothetical protein